MQRSARFCSAGSADQVLRWFTEGLDTADLKGAKALLEHIKERRIDVVVVYKVDRLTRSLTDFAKIVEIFDAHGVSFVAVTKQFNTTTSMGRLTLNVLLSVFTADPITHNLSPGKNCRTRWQI